MRVLSIVLLVIACLAQGYEYNNRLKGQNPDDLYKDRSYRRKRDFSGLHTTDQAYGQKPANRAARSVDMKSVLRAHLETEAAALMEIDLDEIYLSDDDTTTEGTKDTITITKDTPTASENAWPKGPPTDNYGTTVKTPVSDVPKGGTRATTPYHYASIMSEIAKSKREPEIEGACRVKPVKPSEEPTVIPTLSPPQAARPSRLVQPETNLEHLSYVDHSFYKSALVCNVSYFNEHWKNVTDGAKRVVVHPTLDDGAEGHIYRDYALQMKLPFEFPFYGHYLENVTIATGGYIFTGVNGHHWYAQEQNISPLMANFDVSLADNSAIVLYEKDTQVTVVWENMKIREKRNLKFTFGVTLYRNGNIFFFYKDIPIKIQAIDEKSNNIFVGLADSYFLNKMTFYVRRKSVHNYSRIPFNAYDIKSHSILQLIALPSCPIYNTCKACTGHAEKYGSFKCMWCDTLQKCTSGADFFRPYLADCHFSKVCNVTADNETIPPNMKFYERLFNFSI